MEEHAPERGPPNDNMTSELDAWLNELLEIEYGTVEAAATVKHRVRAWLCPCTDGQPCGWPECSQIANGIGRFSMCSRVVLLRSVPDELLRGLPETDVETIRAAVGKPVCLVRERDAVVTKLPGTEEVEFFAADGSLHTIWLSRDHLEEFQMDDDIKNHAVDVQQMPPIPPAWNIVDPSEVVQQHCVGCGKPVLGDRYAWRQRGPFWFEFAHVECAQDVV
jgi:hypothetical protein